MADHTELISELAMIDKMSNQERLKHARKRRLQQLKKWSQHEKEYNSKRKKTEQNSLLNRKPRKNDYKVHFVPSVMLLEAAARNDIEEVRRLLMLGVSPDSTNEDGLTALHQCCIDDSEEMMKLLIEFGANVNAKDSEQWTPLHAAATCGHIHLVEYLINKEADLLAVNADGNMPYDICEDEGTLDFIEYEMAKRGITQEMIDDTRAAIELNMLNFLKTLHEDGEDLEYRDHQGATPLHIAAANGYVSVVEFLLDHNVSTDVCDNDLWQPIHAAACWGHPQVIELLVQAGGDLSAKTKNGETPYDISEDPELKERIIQLKSEMETKRASQPQKLRRSHSQNTRSQSVRRTSIREKIQISRREAQEEARIRRENQYEAAQQGDENGKWNTFHTNPLVGKEQLLIQDDEAKQRQDKSEKAVSEPEDKTPLIIDTIQRLKSPKKEESIPTNEEVNDSDNAETVVASANEKETDAVALFVAPNTPEKQQEVSTNFQEDSAGAPKVPGDSVTVEILVTFNTGNAGYTTNPGTLPDLKKQRSDRRNSGRVTVSSSSSQQDLSNKARNGHCITATYTYDPPPSPSDSKQKYRSDPTEILGETNKQGCCTIM